MPRYDYLLDGWEERKTYATCSEEDTSPDPSHMQGQEPTSGSGHPTEMPSLTGVGDKGGGRQRYLQGLQLSFCPFCMSFSKCCPKRLQAPNPEGSAWLGSSKMSEGIRALHSQWELAGESDLGFLSRSSSGQEGEVGRRGASGTPATAPVIHKELPGVLRALPCHRHRPMMK